MSGSEEAVEDFEPRPHKAVSFVVEREKESRNGMSRSCLRRCLATVEAGQEEAQKKNAVKRRKRRAGGGEKSGRKSLKKWLRASRRMQARMKMPSRPHKEQLGNVSSKIGTVRKSKVEKRRKMTTGEMGTDENAMG